MGCYIISLLIMIGYNRIIGGCIAQCNLGIINPSFSRKEDFPTTSYNNHILLIENNVVSLPIMIDYGRMIGRCIAQCSLGIVIPKF